MIILLTPAPFFHNYQLLISINQSLPHIKSGKLRALGYGGANRTKLMPDLPTNPEFVGSIVFVKFMESETAKWGKVIKEGNIKAE